jgi:hypothetical protein
MGGGFATRSPQVRRPNSTCRSMLRPRNREPNEELGCCRRAESISVGATARGGNAPIVRAATSLCSCYRGPGVAPVGAVRQVGPSPPAKTASPDSGEWPSRHRLRSRKVSSTRDRLLTHRPRMRGQEPKNREANKYFDHCWLMKRMKCVELLCWRENVKQSGRADHRSEGDCAYQNETENRYHGGLEEPHA